MTDPIRIFVGCAANAEDAESQAVLEYSVRSNTERPVEITWMRLSRDPRSPFWSDGAGGGWRTERWATPFSGFRWAIPHLCDFQGRAIYTDSDVIFRADVGELWDQDFQRRAVVLAKAGKDAWRYCVSLWDCERARSIIPHIKAVREDPDAHRKLCAWFAAHPEVVQPFAGNWNCLDGEQTRYGGKIDHPDIKAIHYTDMATQPHLRHALPRLKAKGQKHWYNGEVRQHPYSALVELFDRMLLEAEASGFRVKDYEAAPQFGAVRKADLTGYKGLQR